MELPGQDLIEEGIADLGNRTKSVASLLVCIGYPRLKRIGMELPPPIVDNPEMTLYLLLADEDSDSAHSRYNALIRRLVSYERAAECAG